MLTTVKTDLKKMKVDQPGHRFRNHYRRSAKDGGPSPWERVLFFGGALLSFGVGVVLIFIPGPAFVFFIISGALLASQLRPVAMLMDKSELAVRSAWAALAKKWAARPAWLGAKHRPRSTHSTRRARSHRHP